jgi:hypothetical protein
MQKLKEQTSPKTKHVFLYGQLSTFSWGISFGILTQVVKGSSLQLLCDFHFSVRLGMNSGFCPCKTGARKAGTLPLEPHLQ